MQVTQNRGVLRNNKNMLFYVLIDHFNVKNLPEMLLALILGDKY